MKKKIPFDISYRKQIEDREMQLVTRSDKYKSVRIICWDADDEYYPIIALLKETDYEYPSHYTVNGLGNRGYELDSDLFVIVEDDTTEFEDYVDQIVDPEESRKVGDSRIIAKKLLELAKKELENKFDNISYQEGYDQGFSEGRSAILEKMPIWKKSKPTKGGNFLLHLTGGYVETSDWSESEDKFYYKDGELYQEIKINDCHLLGWIYTEELENLYSE